MKPLLHLRFIHDPFGDPGLYVGVLWERRAFLFDLGDLSPLSPRALLKVSDIFVSHTHMDHFIGFDQILRLRLHRPQTLRVYGPPGLVQNVAGKLSGYTWDRVDEYPLVLEVYEYGESGQSGARFPCFRRFQREDLPDLGLPPGVLLREDWARVRAVELDHGTTVLAFSLEESTHFNIDKDRLRRQGIPVGPWLGELKNQLRCGAPGGKLFRVCWQEGNTPREQERTLEEWCRDLVRLCAGQKIVYVTDIGFTPTNQQKVVDLAAGADLFYCEAQFLYENRDEACKRGHLTARQAGLLARQAQVKKLILFHFSPRYRGREEEILNEAREAFGGLALIPAGLSAGTELSGE
ncbi:MAG: ribonuclease Z [Candidatus Tectomicrobia bacterium]|uniref:Ribonuclease Z n=1 Tax=Tectimicrobiota bacterium TaxID=2528274 RepID=A0A932M1N3_UNCTE|nr:ribonuclease Z [Candidatus Tectomicrobia bacterium]